MPWVWMSSWRLFSSRGTQSMIHLPLCTRERASGLFVMWGFSSHQAYSIRFWPCYEDTFTCALQPGQKEKIGIKAWIREQQTCWNENQDEFHGGILSHQECKRKGNRQTKAKDITFKKALRGCERNIGILLSTIKAAELRSCEGWMP